MTKVAKKRVIPKSITNKKAAFPKECRFFMRYRFGDYPFFYDFCILTFNLNLYKL